MEELSLYWPSKFFTHFGNWCQWGISLEGGSNVEAGHLADGVDEADTADEAEQCGVQPKIIEMVEAVGMEERIVEFAAGTPPSEVSTHCQVYGG
jgi:hypothetical protein